MQPGIDATTKPNRQVDILDREIDQLVLRRNPDIDLGVTLAEIAEPRHQPGQRKGFERADLEGTACVFGLRPRSLTSRVRKWSVLSLLILTLVLMVTDYFWIYSPLHEIVTSPDQVRPAEFEPLHERSKWINFAGLTLCLASAGLWAWLRPHPGEAKQS